MKFLVSALINKTGKAILEPKPFLADCDLHNGRFMGWDKTRTCLIDIRCLAPVEISRDGLLIKGIEGDGDCIPYRYAEYWCREITPQL